MTEESATTSHLSVAMTTTGGGNTMTPASSRGMEFYARCALLVIGIVGMATNGLILYALMVSKQQKKHVLIVNQNALDLFTSFMMVVVHSVKLYNIYLTGSGGYWLCILLVSESPVWWGTFGSVINLESITLERYLKVVHSVWSKKKLKNWMIYSAVAFSWIGSLIWILATVFKTSAVINGTCYTYVIWENETGKIINTIWTVLTLYVSILLIFIFCYWRILAVIRRQAKVMAGHANAGPSTAQAQSHKIQTNIIKTMIFVSALYAILWLPNQINLLNLNLNPNHPPILDGVYYSTLIFAFLYMCTNPFVYATKFDPVKEVLLRLIPCRKNSE